MGFEIKEPPPIQREGKQRVTLPEDEANALLGLIGTKGEDDKYPWAFDDTDYKTRAAAQARVLFYRSELVRLKLIEHPKMLRSRVVEAQTVGGTNPYDKDGNLKQGQKVKYRYGLSYRELSSINEAAGSEDDATA